MTIGKVSETRHGSRQNLLSTRVIMHAIVTSLHNKLLSNKILQCTLMKVKPLLFIELHNSITFQYLKVIVVAFEGKNDNYNQF